MIRISLVFLFILSLSSLGAEEAFKDYKLQTQKLEASKRGTLKGDFAELGAGALNETTGGASFRLPLSFPELRGKQLFPFQITYSPSFGASAFGQGMSFELKIYRYREIGKIDFETDDLMTPWGIFKKGNDSFFYSKDLGQKIRAKVFEDSIEVYSSSGDTFVFGGSVVDKTVKGKIFSWYLILAKDLVGHQSQFSYKKFRADGIFYLNEILYGGFKTDYKYSIRFDYEQLKKPLLDFSLGTSRWADRKVAAISLFTQKENSEFSLRFGYTLSYQDNELTPGFYLKAIEKFYSSGNKDPKIVLNYDLPDQFLNKAKWRESDLLADLGSKYQGQLTNYNYLTLIDINNDGRLDFELTQNYDMFINSTGSYEKEAWNIPRNDVSPWCLFPAVNSRKSRSFIKLFGPSKDLRKYKHY